MLGNGVLQSPATTMANGPNIYKPQRIQCQQYGFHSRTGVTYHYAMIDFPFRNFFRKLLRDEGCYQTWLIELRFRPDSTPTIQMEIS
ncbi:hypothetical protein ScPMuIL_008576 [Solemya velum]